jgi:multiple sugar transport system substrate-binding protein
VWGVPWYTDAGLLYYRSDLLEEAGFSEPPTMWDEMKEMARKTAQEDTGTSFGFILQGAE